jgi:hypothetical protein
MTIIIKDSSRLHFHSDLQKILEPILFELSKMDWLCSEIDLIVPQLVLLDDLPVLKKLMDVYGDNTKWCTFTGIEFTQLLRIEGIQYVWAVFSGFLGTAPILELEDLPYADCNEKIWTHPSAFQLPDSLIEIVCFDASCTILKFQNDQLAKLILDEFPEGRILESSIR